MHGLNIWQILWESGIVVKFVLLLLVMASVLSWTIIWQKYKELKAVTEANDKFNDFFKKSSSIADIHREATENQDSTMGLMFRRGFDELNKTSEKLNQIGKGKLAEYFSAHGTQSLERALKAGYNAANEKMDLRVSLLATIGSITPFVGLFGTVWGIIDAFSGLSQGGGSIEAVAPGIAEALVATVWRQLFRQLYSSTCLIIRSHESTLRWNPFHRISLTLLNAPSLLRRISKNGYADGGQ